VAAATRAALRVSDRESWRREKALALSQRFVRGLREIEANARAPATPTTIVPVVLGEAARALAVSRALESAGFLAMAVRPPTVPAGTARLRVTFSASHEEAQVDALLSALAAALKT
jgi:8-amino-7-oxononanoate synthase